MIKNRIKGLVHLQAAEIKKHPKNWRLHPDEQRNALRAVLDRVGIASASIVYKNSAGEYQLIDGELRRDEISDQPIPCLELDVTDAEADVLLASIDSISALADTDDIALQELIDGLEVDGLEDMLKQIEPDATLLDELEADEEDEGTARYEIAPVFDEGYHAAVIFCKSELEWSKLQQLLNIQRKLEKRPEDKPNSPVGICRVVTFQEFQAVWQSR